MKIIMIKDSIPNNWLKYAQMNDEIWLVKEQEKVKIACNPNVSINNIHKLAIERTITEGHKPNKAHSWIEWWYTDFNGRGLDGKLLIEPLETTIIPISGRINDELEMLEKLKTIVKDIDSRISALHLQNLLK